jgi:2Fe-2S ferredoxin
MAKITFVDASGVEHVVEAEAGQSVMKAALSHDVPGILAECGGTCACGTCRVFVDPVWRERTGAASDLEEGMIEAEGAARPGERLSCQIEVSEALDGLIVQIPASQY